MKRIRSITFFLKKYAFINITGTAVRSRPCYVNDIPLFLNLSTQAQKLQEQPRQRREVTT